MEGRTASTAVGREADVAESRGYRQGPVELGASLMPFISHPENVFSSRGARSSLDAAKLSGDV